MIPSWSCPPPFTVLNESLVSLSGNKYFLMLIEFARFGLANTVLHLLLSRWTHALAQGGGAKGVHPPPRISKIYDFQVVFRPQRIQNPQAMFLKPPWKIPTFPPPSLPNSLIVDSVYDGVPSVHVGVAVRPKINTCSKEMSTRVNRVDTRVFNLHA